MKRTFSTLILAVGLVSVFVATPVSAQSNPAVADIPFSFVASGRTLPAGHYHVSQLNANSSVFTLQSPNGKSIFADLGSRQTGHPNNPSVTFARSGDEWTLVKITPPDSTVAYALGHDQIEKNKKLELATMVSIKLK